MYYTEEDIKKNKMAQKRNDFLLTFEAEFDEFLPIEEEWTKWDKNSCFIVHNGSVFYSKSRMKETYEEEKNITEQSLSDENFKKKVLNKVEKQYDILNVDDENIEKCDPTILKFGNFTTPKIEEMFDKNIKSFPKLITETPHFYQCGQNIKRKITVDDIDKDVVERIQNHFSDDINPFFCDLEDYIFEDENGKFYCLQPLYYSQNPYFKYGFFFNTKNSQKYPNNICIFFSFKKLSSEERNLVIAYYNMTGYNYDKNKNLIFVEF